MDVQHLLKDILKNMYQKLKTSNHWDNSYQQQLRDLSSLETVPLAEVLRCDCNYNGTKRIIT